MTSDTGNIDLRKLRICHYPDPVLRGSAQPMVKIDDGTAALAERMIELMLEANGIGLAGPQVGLPWRIFVARLASDGEQMEVLINPVLSNFQGTCEFEEGCLSIPTVRAKLRRAAACTVTALNLEGNRFVIDVVDLAARTVQHETDHLDGILFIDRLSTVAKIGCRRVLKRLEREYGG